MLIEIINIGSELLSGKTLNTNAKYLTKFLFEKGYQTHFISVYPDDKLEVQNGVKQAFKRADLVILTGGLGPTIDDNTKEIISDLLNIPLEYREDIAKEIEKRFGKIESKINQATVFKNSHIFINDLGTAPGFGIFYRGKTILLLPGVPHELEDMFEKKVFDFINQKFPLKEKIYQETIDFCLLSENKIDEVIKKIDIPQDVEVGIYPYFQTISVTLKAKSKDKDKAYLKINLVKDQLKKKLNEYIFESKNSKIEEAIHDLLIKRDEKLAFAESCSGGVLSSKITAMPDSSKYFLGSFVTYSNELKKNILNVSEKTLKSFGAVSLETAKEMIEGVFKKTNAKWAISITGIAGPSGGTEKKPVGTVCFAIGMKEDLDVGQMHFKGNRDMIVQKSVDFALCLLYRKIFFNLSYFKK